MRHDNPHAFHPHRGLRRGLSTEIPLPTMLVSNEEFPPLPQTPAQRAVEHLILADAARLAPALGLSRRDFLRTSGGMAASLLAMNAVFGHFFDVLPVEASVPKAMALIKHPLEAPGLLMDDTSTRIAAMDAQGIDVEALSINPYWYRAEPDVAAELIRVQNETLVEFCAANPDRFVAFATAALQHPELAAEQVEHAVKKLGFRGVGVGGALSFGEARRFDVFHFGRAGANGVRGGTTLGRRGRGGRGARVTPPLFDQRSNGPQLRGHA